MIEQISSHRAHISLAPSYEAPAELTADSGEELSEDFCVKLKLARDRARSAQSIIDKVLKHNDLLQQELSCKAEQPSAAHLSATADPLADWQYSSQQLALASRVLAHALVRVMDCAPSAVSAKSISHGDFFESIGDSLTDLNDNWLKKYESALAKYIDFFSKFNSIMADLHKYVSANHDGTKIGVDFGELRLGLIGLLAGLNAPGQGLAYFSTREEAQNFIDDLGLTGLTIDGANGSFRVNIDAGPVNALLDSMPSVREEWDMARYNAWLSGKDSYTEQLQHVSKVLGEKYSRNLAQFDNFVKLLSQTVDSIGEADRTFVNNFS